jgi:YbbR domain-containing protein
MPKIFENLWVKLSAIVLAVLLWFHVVTNKVYQEEVTLPLAQVEMSGRLVLTEPPPDSITVIISATGKKLLRSDWKRKGLKLLINRTNPGKFKAEISVGNLSLAKSEKVDIIEVVFPREIEVNCDRRVEKRVPVRSQLAVIPADGFAVSRTDSIVPATVLLIGPADRLEKITHIDTKKDVIDKAKNNLTARVPLEHGDIYGLMVSPDTVEVSVEISAVRLRVFSDIPVKLINAPRGKSFDMIPAKIELHAAGSPGIIDTLSAGKISVVADYGLIDSKGTAPLKIDIPSSISIIHKSVDSVRIFRK